MTWKEAPAHDVADFFQTANNFFYGNGGGTLVKLALSLTGEKGEKTTHLHIRMGIPII